LHVEKLTLAVACGMASRMPSRTQSDTLSSSRSHKAVIRVYDEAGNMIETHEHNGDFEQWC